MPIDQALEALLEVKFQRLEEKIGDLSTLVTASRAERHDCRNHCDIMCASVNDRLTDLEKADLVARATKMTLDTIQARASSETESRIQGDQAQWIKITAFVAGATIVSNLITFFAGKLLQ